MRREAIAARYGRALYELAKESKTQDQIHQELKVVADAIAGDKMLMAFSGSPLVRSANKENAVSGAVQNLKLSTITKNFLLTLARRDRLEILPDVGAAFLKQMDLEAGLTRGDVTSATDLTDAQKKEITETLAKVTGKKVVVNFHKNSKIGGGLSAQVGGLTIDDSVQTHLKRMQDELNRRTQ